MPSANWTEPNKNSTTFKMVVKQGVDPRIVDVSKNSTTFTFQSK